MPSNMDSFRQHILATIDRLDAYYLDPVDPVKAENDYAAAAAEVGNLAARLGHANLYHRSLDFTGMASWPAVKRFLSECLAAVPETPTATPIGETIGAEELAAMLGINIRTLYRRRRDGTLPTPTMAPRA